MARGYLTEKVDAIAVEHIGRKISQVELRLIPYIQFVMVNSQKLEIAKINAEEREVLKAWRTEKFIEGGASGLSITKEFWNFMCAVLFEAYVVGAYE